VITIGSLFAGVGGFDLGFERAGARVLWQVENDAHAIAVLARRWPDVERHEDVCTVGAHNLPRVDVLVGGFPCQDVSIAGTIVGGRRGLLGARSGLFDEFIRIARELRPQWTVIENVSGLLTSRRGRDFHTVLASLAECGFYDRAYRVLDAQYFGVPQRRSRVFVVGCTGAAFGRAASVLFESTSGTRHPGTRRTAQAHAAGRVVSRTLDARGSGIWSGDELNADPITAHEGKTYSHEGRNNFRLRNVVMQRSGFHVDTAHCVTSSMHKGHDEDQDTLIADDGVRRLTPLEAERLQGFPDGHTCLCDAHGHTLRCVCNDGVRYRQLGNAVTVPVAAWIAARLVATHAELAS